MSQRMVHFVGGPADGYVQLIDEKDHPFAMSMSTDTDGYYAMDYQVAGQRIGTGDLELTSDDVIARWHQRSSAHDFMTGDTVIIKATGARAMAFAPTTRVNADGTTNEGWMIAIDSNLTFVAADEIHIATPRGTEQERLVGRHQADNPATADSHSAGAHWGHITPRTTGSRWELLRS
jgi:hypothetical protein